DASIERNDVTNLIDNARERVLDFQRRTKGAGNFIQRVNFAMRAADLIVGSERGVLLGGYAVFMSRGDRFRSRARVYVVGQSTRIDLHFEFRQVVDEQFDDPGIEVGP